tara:strand:- start:86 stop:1627 length:1542 start_codon:yes stop_codon:yes gene_type:complete
MRRLIYLFLLSPILVANTGNWWEERELEQNLGIYRDIFDNLLPMDDSEREKVFNAAAEATKSLACRSEIYFDKSNRDMMQCLLNAEDEWVKPLIPVLESGSGRESGFTGFQLSGYQFYNIQPNMGAALVMANYASLMRECIYENQPSKISNEIVTMFIEGCVDKYPNYIFTTISNADKYTRVKYLQRRGLLISNDHIEISSEEEIVDLSDYEISNLRNELESELVEVFCRSSIGILYVVDAECKEEANNRFLDEINKDVEVSIKNLELDYLKNELATLIFIQYIILSIEKCTPYTDTLDENLAVKDFAFKKIDEDFEANGKAKKWKEYTTGVEKCIVNQFSGFDPALKKADAILKKEDEWKKEVEHQRKLRITNAKLQKDKELEILKAQKEREAEKENVGNLFGRMLSAIIIESADAYIQEKIAKELNIKTGTYHSQDLYYCHYSTPRGMKSVEKKSGKNKTINYGNVGTNKSVISSKNMKGGLSQKNSIYSFNDGSSMKISKTYHYSCPTRI